jgi:hypothetical protein
MKKQVLAFASCLMLLSSACSQQHPTESEKQDFKDGQAFAQDRFTKSGITYKDPDSVSDYAMGFSEDGAFLNHSTYFCFGAYFQEYTIIKKWRYECLVGANGVDSLVRPDKVEKASSQSSSDLSDYAKQHAFSYDQLEKITDTTTDKSLDDDMKTWLRHGE